MVRPQALDGQDVATLGNLDFSKVSFNSTLGAISIGFSLSCVVFGVLTTQVFIYYQRYTADRSLYKFLVSLIWVIELVDQICIGHAVYTYSITNYAQPLKTLTGKITWSLLAQIVLGCFVGTIVKGTFTMRVWRFSNKSLLITGALTVLILTQFALGIVYMVQSYRVSSMDHTSKVTLVATLSLSFGLVTDILIAACLCYFLQRLRTGFKKSDTLVNRLCIYAINTGVLTSAVSLITLLLYNVKPNDYYYMGSYFVLGKLYAISFLCTLNTRKAIRGKGTDREDGSSSDNPNTFYMVTSSGRTPRPPGTTTKTEVGIRQEISVISDLGRRETDEETSDLEFKSYPKPPKPPTSTIDF